MPATPVLALPYPALSDTADVPRDIQALAVKLDATTSLHPPLVTTLPGSPVDGQECYYQNAAMATAGLVWHLRYRAAAAGAYKWEVLGGAGLYSEVVAAEASAATAAYVDLATVGPQVTLPLAGDYDVHIGARINGSAGQEVAMSYAIGATPASNADQIATTVAAAGTFDSASRRRRKTGLAAATALVAKYRGTAASPIFIQERWMLAVPIRVG